MGSNPSITFFDVAFAPPYSENAAAPNPWKSRYALNFKDVPYITQWVQMPDVAKTRQGLGIPPCRKFKDGTDYYTLPVVTDSATGAKLGDSFDIASYLEKNYPNSGAGNLFPADIKLDYTCPVQLNFGPPLTERDDKLHVEYGKFNDQVDMAFTLHVQLMFKGMKWDPKLADGIRAEFARRAGAARWEDLSAEGEAREKLMGSLRDTLRDLAGVFQRDSSGPFVLGEKACYADIIVGGWLCMMSRTLPEGEWEQVRGWYDGVFGRLHDALQERFGDVK